jgi:hypothetical protein
MDEKKHLSMKLSASDLLCRAASVILIWDGREKNSLNIPRSQSEANAQLAAFLDDSP